MIISKFYKFSFRFDELGRCNAIVEIQSDMPHEDFMDLAVSDVREGLLTYFPMKITVKESPVILLTFSRLLINRENR